MNKFQNCDHFAIGKTKRSSKLLYFFFRTLSTLVASGGLRHFLDFTDPSLPRHRHPRSLFSWPWTSRLLQQLLKELPPDVISYLYILWLISDHSFPLSLAGSHVLWYSVSLCPQKPSRSWINNSSCKRFVFPQVTFLHQMFEIQIISSLLYTSFSMHNYS